MELLRKFFLWRFNVRRLLVCIYDLVIIIFEDGMIDMMFVVDMDFVVVVYFEKGVEVLFGKEIFGMC